MKTIENLKWRYATKKFDAEKKVSEENLEKIKEAIQLSPSSYGMQLYKVVIVNDDALREELKPHCWHQPQITDASHLFIFCNYSALNPEQVNDYFSFKAKALGMDADALQGYGDFVNKKVSEKTKEEISNWNAKQTYIALGNALTACAELHIDACPMEGFEAVEVNKVLGLEEHQLEAAVIMAVGYRSKDDETQHTPKIRRPKEELFLIKEAVMA